MSDVYVLMGVCGCGKTVIGEGLASATGGRFFDGDDYHTPENVEKMRSGRPLNDDDRAGWLDRLAELIGEQARLDAPPAFVACSALKDKYRQILQRQAPVRWIHLVGRRELLESRMKARENHYMPAGLLDSQLATLEAPDDATIVDVTPAPEAIVRELIERLELETQGNKS